jgi:DTW domain-containing protein YfiP
MLGKSANVVRRQLEWLPRSSCLRCRRPLAACYCTFVKPFESKPRFVILTHPKEAKHSFGTGRMAYLCIRNSLRIEGADFSEDEATNRMIQDPDLFSVVLYPGPGATNLSMVPASQRAAFVPTGRELNVFVLDGTWKTAGKMIRLSRNLQVLPLVCFVPPTPSAFRIRRQPHPDFYSTIEAIHHVIDLFAPTENENPAKPRPHDNLLAVFGTAVSRQLYYTDRS